MNYKHFWILVSILIGPIFLTSAQAQDTLFTKYGDVLLGKIEKITAEKIYFKTAYRTSAVDINLSEIARACGCEYILIIQNTERYHSIQRRRQ